MKSYLKILLFISTTFLVVTNTLIAQNVYPGDANQDSIVNNIDLLYIGKNNGFSGPARSITSNNFSPQLAPALWGFSYYNTNAMYSDCNGDGEINANDTLAINKNYGLNYGLIPNAYYNNDNSALEISTNRDTISLGDTLILNFTYNTNENVLGMAFSLNFESAFSNLISSFSYDTSTVWFTGPENYSISKQNTSQNAIEMAVVRKDNFQQNGSGSLGELSIIIEEDLLGGIIQHSGYFNFKLNKVLKADDFKIDTLGSSTKVIYFKNLTSSIKKNENFSKNFKAYPNTVENLLQVENLKKIKDLKYSLTNINGKKVKFGDLNLQKTEINFSDYSKGIYLLEITDKKQIKTFTKRILKK